MPSRSVEGSPSTRCEQRPPLRSLENEKQHLSTPLLRRHFKSLSKVEKEDVCLDSCSPPTSNVTQTIKIDDVTIKSFICSSGEVVISDETSLCTEDQIFLPQDQTIGASCENEDTGTSETCSVHMEHPYCHPKSTNAAFGEVVPANTGPIDFFECDIREMDVSATSRQPDETIPLVIDDKHVDDLYYCQDEGTPNEVCDVTFKSFTCDGGELEIPNVTQVEDETVPLPAEHMATSDPELSFLPSDVELCSDHVDHPYCHFETSVDTFGQEGALLNDLVAFPEEQAESFQFHHHESRTLEDIQKSHNDDIVGSLTPTLQTLPDNSVSVQEEFDEISVGTQMLNETFPPPAEPIASAPSNPQILPADVQICHLEKNPLDPVIETEMDRQVVPEEQTGSKNQTLTVDPIEENQNDDILETSTPSPPEKTLAPESIHLKDHETPERHDDGMMLPEVQLDLEFSEGKDSALGLSENRAPALSPVEKPLAETMPDVLKVLSECPSVVSALQLMSPVRRASLSLMRTRRDPAVDFEKNELSPELASLWTDQVESPMHSPLFNSTTLSNKIQPEGQQAEDKNNQGSKVPAGPFIPDGPLQQQLRQMAEFLLLASGKMDFAVAPAAPPIKSSNVGVGVTPVKKLDRSLNTSGEFVRKGEYLKMDACTLTDPLPLLWNCHQESLDSVPREELEQRLMSSMVMVEALVQQLAAARAVPGPHATPAPSELRNKLVQTEHTELSQTTMYRDLYMEALNRISNLEQDGRSLQELVQQMQGMRVTMASLAGDTDAALSDAKKMEALVREDHQTLSSHYGEMKSLYTKFKEMQLRMMQKVDEAFGQRDEMKTRMEDAQKSKEAAFSTVEQLRAHCASEMAALQRSLGSQQELLAALNVTFPEQVALNKMNGGTLNSASDLLCQTMEDQIDLTRELSVVRSLVQRSAPMLVKLNEKTAAALTERDQHMSARERVQEEREQVEEELREALLNLQTAQEQIGDLNLQATILTSEMSVLRQKLKEHEEQRAQLERTVTEMSATVSSTTAAHTFLEHTLAEETSKLEQAQKDASQAKEKADYLASSLCQVEEWAEELIRNLAEKEEDLGRLQALSQSQSLQIQQLTDVCTQLSEAAETNEFLQAENEMARDQLAESENVSRVLHERNIQCEDLKAELCQLQRERRSMQEELEAERSRASTAQRKRAEELAQAVTETTLLHHTLRGMTNELHDALGAQKPEPKNSSTALKVDHRQPSSSFVDCVMVALTADKNEEEEEANMADVSTDSPRDSIFSKSSAFTRLPVTPKKKLVSQESDDEEKREQSSLLEALAHLSNTVTELVGTLESVQRHKDARLEELQHTVFSQQMALQDANSKHKAEESELKLQLSRMRTQAERCDLALQQQAQDSKTITKLMNDVTEAQEQMIKYRLDYNELRKETTELRRSLQQSETEAQILRAEFRKTDGQTAGEVDVKEEKLLLLKEVDRLKTSLREMEQTRHKLLERAKRHQQIQQMNQQKCENEVHMLNNMINKVRETLRSLPEAVKTCEQLQQLLEYLG
ncbi:sperm-associated antigen 5 [Syngnathus scovelli]|uniref:sperm-associated antigen 5 n=1 Tax=Syngnathus scovelli TaxID=161590 RepID=UPI0021101CF3|nr:sperm-associated antigen 5 [Syngnathus scovelli]XP_049576262.1 sperm-associated antigen 5 [Syngnathus scovelli]